MTQYFSSLSDDEIVRLLRDGAVGVLPTDTVYGLVAVAHNQSAVSKMYHLKQRERQPGTIIAASVEQLADLGFSRENLAIGARYWPNPVSVVMDAKEVPAYLKCGLADLPARIPDNPTLLKVLQKTGPLMTTSANAPKQPTSTNVRMARNYFADTVEFYVDGGDLSLHQASTIIGIGENGTVTIFRKGSVQL